MPQDLGDLVERLRAYMLKAVKEAKRHTSWLTPNEEYERAVTRFVDRVLTGPGRAKFLSTFAPFARRVARVGMINGLAQVTLKIGSPGIPDFYQGAELWDLSLVDPDNRRPVDFAHRQCLLASVDQLLQMPAVERAPAIAELVTRWQDGRIKMLLTTAGLRLRRDWRSVFLSGRYLPLATDVTVPAGLVAFARLLDDRAVLFVAPRMTARLFGATDPRSAASARGRDLEDITNHPAAGAPWTDVPPPRHRRRDPLDRRFWRSVDFRRPGLRDSSSRHPDVGGYLTGGLENATRSRVMRETR